MYGTYTVNPNGSNLQQIATTGDGASWQGAYYPITPANTSAAARPGAPITGAGTPISYEPALFLLVASVVCIALGIMALRKRSLARAEL